MFTTRPEIAGTFGVVASTHWIASQVGMAVLERGGNAFDAAVAAGFTLHMAEPHLNGPGGDAPIILDLGIPSHWASSVMSCSANQGARSRAARSSILCDVNSTRARPLLRPT